MELAQIELLGGMKISKLGCSDWSEKGAWTQKKKIRQRKRLWVSFACRVNVVLVWRQTLVDNLNIQLNVQTCKRVNTKRYTSIVMWPVTVLADTTLYFLIWFESSLNELFVSGFRIVSVTLCPPSSLFPPLPLSEWKGSGSLFHAVRLHHHLSDRVKGLQNPPVHPSADQRHLWHGQRQREGLAAAGSEAPHRQVWIKAFTFHADSIGTSSNGSFCFEAQCISCLLHQCKHSSPSEWRV